MNGSAFDGVDFAVGAEHLNADELLDAAGGEAAGNGGAVAGYYRWCGVDDGMAMDLKLFDVERQALASFDTLLLDPRSRPQEFGIDDAMPESLQLLASAELHRLIPAILVADLGLFSCLPVHLL